MQVKIKGQLILTDITKFYLKQQKKKKKEKGPVYLMASVRKRTTIPWSAMIDINWINNDVELFIESIQTVCFKVIVDY